MMIPGATSIWRVSLIVSLLLSELGMNTYFNVNVKVPAL